MPWNFEPERAWRNCEGTDTRPLRSTLFSKVPMKKATSLSPDACRIRRCPASRSRKCRKLGSRQRDTMDYHGILWVSMPPLGFNALKLLKKANLSSAYSGVLKYRRRLLRCAQMEGKGGLSLNYVLYLFDWWSGGALAPCASG